MKKEKAKKQNNVDHPEKSKSGTYSWETMAKINKEIGLSTSLFLFCFPSVFERNLSILKDSATRRNITVSEYVIERLEKEAKNILRENNYPTDIKKMQSIKDYDPLTGDEANVNIQIVNAKQVILSANALRDNIKKNHTENAVIEAFRLLAAAITANIEYIAWRGIRSIIGPEKKKKPRSAQGILSAIKHALRDGKGEGRRKVSDNLWNYFKKNHQEKPYEIGDYEIYFKKDKVGLGEDELYEIYADDPKSKKSITFATFQKHTNKIKKFDS